MSINNIFHLISYNSGKTGVLNPVFFTGQDGHTKVITNRPVILNSDLPAQLSKYNHKVVLIN